MPGRTPLLISPFSHPLSSNYDDLGGGRSISGIRRKKEKHDIVDEVLIK
jgi:hypothetical protein